MGSSAQEFGVESLHRRHRTALHRFLRRLMRNDEAAADVAQDVWLRLLRFVPNRPVDDARAYLFRVARNAAHDRLTRDRDRAPPIADGPPSDRIACPDPGPEATMLARDRLRVLAEAVETLPPRCREVFLMSRLDGLSNPDIAARLGISRNMVEKHIIKAMLHCRRHLGVE